MGATHALAAGAEVIERVREITGGRGADHAFEAVGLEPVEGRELFGWYAFVHKKV